MDEAISNDSCYRMAMLSGQLFKGSWYAGSLLKLNGPGAFNAAVHCAKVSAAKRLRRCQAGHLQRRPFSSMDPPEAELQELMLSDDQVSPC